MHSSGEHDDVVQYITALSKARAQLVNEVTARIDDSALAALLIAKVSLAAERGVGLRISGASRLDRLDELSADLVTVVGNLVDNALEAVGSTPDGWVEIHLQQGADTVEAVVSDSGPDIAPELAEEVFTSGSPRRSPRAAGSAASDWPSLAWPAPAGWRRHRAERRRRRVQSAPADHRRG